MTRLCPTVLTLLILAALACGCETSTPVLAVDLRTDFVGGVDFVTIHTVLQRVGSTDGVAIDRSAVAGQYADGQRVAEFQMPPVGAGLVIVSLRDAEGETVAARRLSVAIEASLSRVVTVVMDRRCAEVVCPPDDDRSATECFNGECVPPSCDPSEPGSCGAAACPDDASCADLECGAGCATPVCAQGACLCQPNDEACDDGEVCHPNDGCVVAEVTPESPDAGVGGDPCAPADELCNNDDDDCDGLFDEGFALSDDPLNCGACGIVCPDENGTASCAAGVCELDCDPGFLDCDADTGCESNATTAAQCGACDISCGGATPVCSAGTAETPECGSDCSAPQTRCGASCVDTRTALAHCGGCGLVCGPANATPDCVAGACGVESCDEGFLDCNESLADGCEVDRGRSSEHCGRCGNACGPNAGCSAGTCTCAPGFADCDEEPGCESELSAPTSCGACGNRCGEGEICDADGGCRCGATMMGIGSGPACTGETVCCGDACRDLSSDEAACGSCGDACREGESCIAGACLCGGGECGLGTCCDGACVDLATDSSNCLGCGVVCAENAYCGAGGCLSPGECDGCEDSGGCCTAEGCVSRRDNDAHCGACGVECDVAEGERCVGSDCLCAGRVCAEGSECCAGDCLLVRSDTRNCGGCGIMCGPGELCEDARCVCGLTPGTEGAGPACGGQTCCDGSCREAC